MSVKFKVIKRVNPQNRTGARKYFPSIIATGHKNLRQLSQRAAQISTLRAPDLASVIETFLTLIPLELAEGNVVELGDFGSFWLKTTTLGAETAEEVRADQITHLVPRFIPGKEFKKLIRTIELEKVKPEPTEDLD
jgi:predicted histone-like DNA-binding protein